MQRFLATLSMLLLGMITSIPAEASETAAPPEGKILVKLGTSKGDIVLELDRAKAPATVDNFVGYVREGFYDGLIFHRVINGFMIQGGGLDKDMVEKRGKQPIQNEADNGLKNEAYTIAMARTNDPHSATSQFFINVVDNAMLNHSSKTLQGWGYAVFGRVTQGKEVVDAIKAVPTTSKGMYDDVPSETVTILKAELLAE